MFIEKKAEDTFTFTFVTNSLLQSDEVNKISCTCDIAVLILIII